MNKNIIYNLDFLHTSDDLIEDNSIDLVIIDPPYNIGVEKWDKIKDYVDWSKYYLDIIFKKMKNNSSLWIYGSANKNFEYLEILLYIKSKLSLVNWVIWCKNSGLKNVKNKFAPSHEDIVWFSKGNNIYNLQKVYSKTNNGYKRYKSSDIDNDGIIRVKDLKLSGENYAYDVRKKRGASDDDIIFNINEPNTMCLDWWDDISNLHNKQDKLKNKNIAIKPLELSKRIILSSSNENDLILIPFAGLGSETIMCKNLNRNFISFEKEKEQCDIIKNRLNNYD